VQYTCADSLASHATCEFIVHVVPEQAAEPGGLTMGSDPASTTASITTASGPQVPATTLHTTAVSTPSPTAAKERCFHHQRPCPICYLGHCETECPTDTYSLHGTCYLLPPAPTDVVAQGRAVDSVVVQWRSHLGQSDVTGFQVFYSTVSGNPPLLGVLLVMLLMMMLHLPMQSLRANGEKGAAGTPDYQLATR